MPIGAVVLYVASIGVAMLGGRSGVGLLLSIPMQLVAFTLLVVHARRAAGADRDPSRGSRSWFLRGTRCSASRIGSSSSPPVIEPANVVARLPGYSGGASNA
jgi:hypothetical protein